MPIKLTDLEKSAYHNRNTAVIVTNLLSIEGGSGEGYGDCGCPGLEVACGIPPVEEVGGHADLVVQRDGLDTPRVVDIIEQNDLE